MLPRVDLEHKNWMRCEVWPNTVCTVSGGCWGVRPTRRTHIRERSLPVFNGQAGCVGSGSGLPEAAITKPRVSLKKCASSSPGAL